MKRWLPLLAILSAVTGTVIEETSRGQVPPGKQNPFPFEMGPGEQGAVLKRSSTDASTNLPSGLQQNWNPLVAPNWNANMPPAQRIAMPPSNRTDINRDIEVTPEVGTWMILVTSYSGEKAPYQAREFASLLYNEYKMKPYIFNYGAKEKREEYERAEAERARIRQAMQSQGLPPTNMPIRVRVTKIDEHTGVLIGGYRTRDEALADLKKNIRGLKPPDPKKVSLAVQYVGAGQPDKNSNYPCSTIKVDQEHSAYANPFATAFPVRNPSLPADQAGQSAQEEVEYLRKINKHEPFSLFNCKKPYTLAIKEYKTTSMAKYDVKDETSLTKRFVKALGEWDFAAQNAHKVAEAFRKAGLPETYVLHARYCSYVTVGGFDSPEDQRLVRMQNDLEQYFRHESLRPLELFPRPIPMEVPH
jgi:hypothetical protein